MAEPARQLRAANDDARRRARIEALAQLLVWVARDRARLVDGGVGSPR